MTPRERMLAAFSYSRPDRIPVVYHPSTAGLHVHGRKLLDLLRAYPPDNPIAFTEVPRPPTGTVDASGRYREVRIDAWGTEWEFLIFGIQGHPRRYPLSGWDADESYEFPLPQLDRERIGRQRRDYLVFGGGVSIFEKLHALRPMDELFVDLATGESSLLRFLDRLVDYWLEDVQLQLEAGVDVIMFGDDWGTQQAPLVSPSLFRDVFKPRYERLMTPVHAAGAKVFFHSCGCLEGILDELLDLGIDGLWPQIGLFEADPANIDKCLERHVAIYIHPDRQYLVPNGTPAEIDREIERYARRYHEQGGGGIFYAEIENDAPFENVQALIESIARRR